jgi:hypothetical protein
VWRFFLQRDPSLKEKKRGVGCRKTHKKNPMLATRGGRAGPAGRPSPGVRDRGAPLRVAAISRDGPSFSGGGGGGGGDQSGAAEWKKAARSQKGASFERTNRRKGRPAWRRSPDDSPLRDGNRDRLIGFLTERAARTLVSFFFFFALLFCFCFCVPKIGRRDHSARRGRPGTRRAGFRMGGRGGWCGWEGRGCTLNHFSPCFCAPARSKTLSHTRPPTLTHHSPSSFLSLHAQHTLKTTKQAYYYSELDPVKSSWLVRCCFVLFVCVFACVSQAKKKKKTDSLSIPFHPSSLSLTHTHPFLSLPLPQLAFMRAYPIPRDEGNWEDISGATFLRKLLSLPIGPANLSPKRAAVYQMNRRAGINPREVAASILSIRTQLAAEFAEDLADVGEENAALMREAAAAAMAKTLASMAESSDEEGGSGGLDGGWASDGLSSGEEDG